MRKTDAKIILRSGEKVILPKDVYDEIYGSGKFITVNKIKRKSGTTYNRVMVCKKRKSIDGGGYHLRISLARYMMKTEKGKHADHKDCDPLNNMWENLRSATPSQNGANRIWKGKYMGVSKMKDGKSYKASCKKDGVTYNAFKFETQKSAALAYNEIKLMLFGEFAKLNDI